MKEKNNDSLEISIDKKYLKETDNFNILSLFGKENMEEIQNIISEVTGLAFVTVDYKGEPLTECTRFTSYCKKIRENPMYESLCKLSDASGAIRAAVTKKNSVYFCPFGLLEVAIPVIINGKYLGGFIGGQIKCTDAPKNVYRIQEALLLDTDFDQESMKEYMTDVKEFSYSEFLSVSRLVELIISQLTKKELISSHHEAINKSKITELEEKLQEKEFELEKLKDFERTVKNDLYKFFFKNSMNSALNLATIENADRTVEFIMLYKKYLESNMDMKNISLKESINIAKYYLDMKKIQYMDKMSYEISLDKEIENVVLPFRVILPYVHYLTFFGVNMLEGKYHLNINVKKQNKDVLVEFEDNGPGNTSKEVEEKFKLYEKEYEGDSILTAIEEVNNRMIKTFGKKYEVKINAVTGKGTNIKVLFPIRY